MSQVVGGSGSVKDKNADGHRFETRWLFYNLAFFFFFFYLTSSFRINFGLD